MSIIQQLNIVFLVDNFKTMPVYELARISVHVHDSSVPCTAWAFTRSPERCEPFWMAMGSHNACKRERHSAAHRPATTGLNDRRMKHKTWKRTVAAEKALLPLTYILALGKGRWNPTLSKPPTVQSDRCVPRLPFLVHLLQPG